VLGDVVRERAVRELQPDPVTLAQLVDVAEGRAKRRPVSGDRDGLADGGNPSLGIVPRPAGQILGPACAVYEHLVQPESRDDDAA
jgi:hypothetical protein